MKVKMKEKKKNPVVQVEKSRLSRRHLLSKNFFDVYQWIDLIESTVVEFFTLPSYLFWWIYLRGESSQGRFPAVYLLEKNNSWIFFFKYPRLQFVKTKQNQLMGSFKSLQTNHPPPPTLFLILRKRHVVIDHGTKIIRENGRKTVVVQPWKKNKENKQNLVEVVLFFINYFFSPLNNSWFPRWSDSSSEILFPNFLIWKLFYIEFWRSFIKKR